MSSEAGLAAPGPKATSRALIFISLELPALHDAGQRGMGASGTRRMRFWQHEQEASALTFAKVLLSTRRRAQLCDLCFASALPTASATFKTADKKGCRPRAAMPKPAQRKVLKRSDDAVNCVAWHPSQKTIAVGADDGRVTLYDATKGKERKSYPAEQRLCLRWRSPTTAL